MTLTELLEVLTQNDAIPPTRLKDMKTSLRYLARAMNATPESLMNAETLGADYRATVRAYFTQMSPAPSRHTVRNTMNNLSFFFRTAREHGLMQAFIPRPARQKITDELEREASQTSPYRKRMPLEPYVQPFSTWPADIRKHWTNYIKTRQFDLRASSMNGYEQRFSRYVSYLLVLEKPPVKTWNQIFNPQCLQRFLQWHAARVGASRVTQSGRDVARFMITLATHEARPELPALKALAHKMPQPEPMHDKQRPEHSLTLQEIENVGLTLLTEVRQSLVDVNTKSNRPTGKVSTHGSKLASEHGKALILRLLVRVPLRQRNIREMQLGHNLYRDHEGIWQLHFQGEDLKIGQRDGRTNTFHVPFPLDLIEHLDEYLKRYRPVLLQDRDLSFVFFQHRGRPYTGARLRQGLFLQMYARTGKRFYPHLIRTIWTDTFLLKTHDVSTAAYMLNDRPETVLKRYHELRANDHIEKAHQFTQSLLGA